VLGDASFLVAYSLFLSLLLNYLNYSVSLALIESQCFLGQFLDILSKLYFMEAIIRPAVLYGSEIWGSSLLQTDWAKLERVQTLLLRRIIRSKWTVLQSIIQAEFGVHPFHFKVIFRLVSFLHRIKFFEESTIRRERNPYLALCSSEALASDPPRLCTWLVLRGVSTSPVYDYLPRVPSPVQFLT
jgi:hypothetical protein